METASPNPFLKQNGSELFCGTPTNGKLHPCSGSFHDEDDFGPETDVDMVDDVLLSPTIAAAKKLVSEKSEFENDLERQRHQMSDFDDPADFGRSRDTPTPPAHEVVGNVDDAIAAESGEGEESEEEEEEEWNYFCGSTQNNKNTSVNTELEDSDMMSQLNPDAAEFVPVSPSRFMMDPDPVISSSPMHGHEKSLDNVALPSQVEFNLDIAHRPGQLDSSGTESQFWSESGTGNENTQLAKSEEISTNAEYGDSSTLSFEASANNSTDQMLGKLSCDVTHNELDSFDNKNTEYVNTFGSQNMNSFKDLAIYPNTEVKSLHQPTDVDSDLKVYCLPQEPDDSIVPDTPKSTAVEAPVSPIDMEMDIDSPDENQHNQKSPELISPSDGHLEGLSAQEPTSSSGFESESGADEPETHISDDLKLSEGDGFTIEHRSPPVQPVHFKPIDTFSDTNPFDVLDNLTSPSTEKETPLIQPSAGTLNIGVDSLREIHTELQNPKDNFEIETHLHENVFSSLPTEQYNANEKYQETLTSILNESQGIDEFKQLEKNIPKDDNLLTGQFEFKSDMAKTEQTSLFSGSNTCSFQSKDTELDTSEPTESKVVPSIEPSEAEGEAKLKGNIFNTITGLEFETSKQEFDDKVSDIIFGSRDSELAFDSGKSCEMETVINSSEHQIHNFEEVQFDTSKSNKLESKYLDIHFGTDDIEFDTDYNDYGISNKNVENSLPCKEETGIKTIDEERKLVDNGVKNEKDVENETTQTNSNIDGDSIECSNIMKNVEVTQSIDDSLSSAKELVEVSVSSANEQLVNTSENLLTELHEDQIVDSKVMSAYDFDKFPEYDFDNLSDKFLPVQDVQGEIVTESHENNEANKLDKESSKDVVLDEIGNEIRNVETEICSDVKEVEANTIPFIHSEFTHSPLNVITSDKVEEPISFKTETNNSIHLDEIKDVTFETPLIAELGQSVVPQTENEAMSEILNNETLAVTDEPSKTICQNESCVVEDKSDDLKENEKLVEVETNIIPTATAEDVAVEIKESSEFCKFNTTTEVQELSVSESQMPKPPHFEDTTSTVSEVVIPTLNETCIMPVTELDLPEVSSDKDLKRENETQLLLQSETTETLQTEETGEMLTVTETPPPTPSPGIVEEEGRKEGLLAVAAAAAAAAAGVATVAGAVGSDSKQAPKKLAATSKKPATSASKKPLDSGTKTAVKPPLKTTVSPSKPATSKPSPQTVPTKKPTITGVSKTTKPATSDVKTTPTSLKPAPSKPSTPTSRTTTTTSKPTTSHSKPSTPTSRPVSASKSDIAKSPLTKPALPAKTTAAKPAKPAASTVKVTEKKPLTNGEVLKPAVKKVDHSETKKLPLSAASKPATTVGRPASVAPVKLTATKVSTTTVKSSVAAKTPAAAPIQSKPTPPVSNSVKQSTKANTSTLVAKNRPPSASTLKPTDKTGKDSVNKQISSVKTSTASKVSPGNKTSLKTESKVSSKIDSAKLNKSSKDQVKKPVGTKKLESTQEHTITTTNGYTDIIEIEVKKEELSHGDSNQEAVQALE